MRLLYANKAYENFSSSWWLMMNVFVGTSLTHFLKESVYTWVDFISS